jgi:hypothetical protein
MVPENRISFQLILTIVVVALSSVGQGTEVRWIEGQSYPHPWSIEPTQPIEADVIQFSGVTRYYVNHCEAEGVLGGVPALAIDPNTKTIELQFNPPATSDCTSASSPVCGLEGFFGPLEVGAWRFFCTTPGVTFSLDIRVEAVRPRPVYFVDASATGTNTNTGLSWDDAFTDLQSALRVAVPDSEIRVAQGTYRPELVAADQRTDPNSTFKLGAGVVLKGGYAGARGTNPNERYIAQYETILSGDLAGDDRPVARLADLISDSHRADNVYHVVTLSETDSSSVLDGFTITGGVAMDTELPDKLGCGGGIYNDGGSATVRNCTIFSNAADYHGGGIYNSGPGGPAFVTCMVAENWAQRTGGAISSQGSGTVTMSQCIVTGNAAQFNGGAISDESDGEFLISNSLLSGNMAAEPVAGGGGALYNSLAYTRLSNCTIVGNMAAMGTAFLCEGAGSPGRSGVYLGNCIVWGDGGIISSQEESAVEIVYSDVRGGWSGQGNIDADPCFVDPGYWDNAGTEQDFWDDTWIEGDYHLKAASACIDAGSVEALPDANGTDLDGQPRLSGVAPDMGAYEVQNDAPVADAGPDVTSLALGGAVTLDGSKSYDPEGQPLQYRWYEGDKLVSEQARFTITLPPGEHTLRLVVTDPMGLTASDEVQVTVSGMLQVDALVSPQVIDRHSSKAITAIIVMPKGTRPKDVDLSQPLVLSPGNVPATKQEAIMWLSGYTMVLADFPRAGLVAAVPQNGSVELQIVGRLKDGRQFSGHDTVTIK